MDSQIAVEFGQKFEPNNKKHVVWWKMLCDQMDKAAENTRTHRIGNIIDLNPMGIKFNMSNIMDIVFIQFTLGLTYARAVLEGNAYIPSTQTV